MPRLLATYVTHEPAIALSKGLDRDRAVDESGHQVAVFGRIGGRPFTLEEMRRLYVGRDGILEQSDPAAERAPASSSATPSNSSSPHSEFPPVPGGR
jgi:hypothetical protein